MFSDDLAYYRQRAVAEREAAKDSSNSDVAEIHEELADLYEALIEHEELRPFGLSYSPHFVPYPAG